MLVMKRISLVLATLAFSSPLFALNLQTYRFSDSYRYSILDDSLQEKFPGRYVFTASYGHVRSPFYMSDRNLETMGSSIIDYNNVLTLGGSYYLNKNVSFGVDVSALNNQVFDEGHNSLGDTTLKSRINLRRTDSFSLSVNPQVFLPTGKADNFSTQGSVGGALSIVAEKTFRRLHFLGSLGGLSSKNNIYREIDHRQLLLTQFGVSYDVLDSLNINLESYRNFPFNGKLQDEGKYFATAKHKTGECFSTFGGAGISGFDRVERRTLSFFVGVKFHEKEKEAPKTAMATPQEETYQRPEEPIYFAHDHYDLEPSEISKLDEYVSFLSITDEDIKHVTIEGFASSVGPRAYNQRLSEKRAQTVKSYFVEKGVPEKKLSTHAVGEDFVQETNEANNRRVNFRIQQ